jgi:hypothetical protein
MMTSYFLFVQTFMAEAEKLPGIISFHRHLSPSKRGMRTPHELIHFWVNGFFIIANRAPQFAQFPRLILLSILMFLIPALVFLQTGQWGML